MSTRRQYAVLGPLPSAVETRAFLGCEMVDGMPRRDAAVVVVWLPQTISSDPKLVERLQRETAFVTKLDHPNVLRVHGLECFEEGWARIVDYGDGEPLSRLIDASRETKVNIPAGVIARIVADACDAVQFAQEHGQKSLASRPIVHGGLRPDTLLISFRGKLLVTGYGASTMISGSLEDLGPRAAFLAPEQVIGGKATASAQTDVYALGAVLYTLLAGRPPFSGQSNLEGAILAGEPEALGVEGLAGALAQIARKAMSKRGAERYPSAGAMREAIIGVVGVDGLVSRDLVAAVVNDLIPPDAGERIQREALLDSTDDPDAVTVLSAVTDLPDGIDGALFEASRPRISNSARPATVQDREPELPPPAAAATDRVVDDVAPDWGAGREESSPQHGVVAESGNGAYPAPIPQMGEEIRDTEATVTESRESHGDGGDIMQVVASEIAEEPPTPSILTSGPAGLAVKIRDPLPREAETVLADGPPKPPRRAAPDRAKTVANDGPPRAAAHSSNPPHERLGPSTVSEMTSRIPGRGSSRAGGAIDREMAFEETPGPIPRSPIREDSITAFRKDVGDSSRSMLFLVVIGAVAIIAGIFYFSKAPEVLQQDVERHKLPKEALEIALKSPGVGELPSEDAPPPDDPGQPALVPPGVLDENSPPPEELAAEAPAPKIGTLMLSTDPPVDVYDGQKLLGRTPISVDLAVGNHRIRLTDKDTLLNLYKQYRILPGGQHKDHIAFAKTELRINAPKGSSVVLNGTVLGEAPIAMQTIYQGSYHLVVQHDGRKWVKTFEAPPGGKIEYTVKMDK